MKTKYRISVENTYLGPIASVPNCFFNELGNTSTPIERIDNEVNNNRSCKRFATEYYECWLKSATVGKIQFRAGHHKHTFTTSNRPIKCKLIEGQLKVKCECGSLKYVLTEDSNTITLLPDTKYFVKNNSLRRECIVQVYFGAN